jgi:hypothetical protein
LGFFYPLLRQSGSSEGDDGHLGITRFKFCFVWEQLHHMFSAGQSTQVAQENQQGVASLAPGL